MSLQSESVMNFDCEAMAEKCLDRSWAERFDVDIGDLTNAFFFSQSTEFWNVSLLPARAHFDLSMLELRKQQF